MAKLSTGKDSGDEYLSRSSKQLGIDRYGGVLNTILSAAVAELWSGDSNGSHDVRESLLILTRASRIKSRDRQGDFQKRSHGCADKLAQIAVNLSE